MGQAGILDADVVDEPAPPRPDDPRPDPARRSRHYLSGVVALQIAALSLVLSRTYFFGDDLMLFAQVRERDFGDDYLRLHVFGHFSPGHRLVDWIAYQIGPMSWSTAALIVGSQLVICSLLLHKVVRFLAPDKAWPTLLIAIFATSPLVMGSAMWWAAAGHMVPATLFSLLAALAALHYDRQPRWTLALGYAAALTVALLFQEKAVVVPAGIAALLWAAQDCGDLRTSRATAQRCAPLLAISAAALATFAAVITFGRYNADAPHPSLTTWWEWALELVRAGPFAGAAGVSPNHFSGADRALLLWVAGLAVLGVVVGTSVRRRGAWRAWAFLAVWFLPAISLTAYGRAEVFGASVAGDFHYPGELAYLVVIALTIALTRPTRDGTPRRLGDGRIALALVPVLALSFVSDVRYADRFPGDPARSYLDNLSRSYDALPPGRYRLVDAVAPADVIPPDLAPYNCVSVLVDLLPSTRDLATGTTGERLHALPDGTLQRRFSPLPADVTGAPPSSSC